MYQILFTQMNYLFSRSTEFYVPEETVESDEEYIESDNEDVVIVDYKPLYEYNDQITFARICIDELLKIDLWAFNRPLDIKHVKEIKSQIIKTKYIHGIFCIAYLINEKKYYIIDGQHRYTALKDIKKKHLIKDVVVNIYTVEQEQDIVQLFKDINNTKPLSPKETPNLVIVSALEKLETDYPEAIKNGDKTVYPYLLKKDIHERLKQIDINCDANELYLCIKRINKLYSKTKITEIPNVRSKITVNTVKKTKTSNFYLGLDEKWSWIEQVEELIK